MAEQSAQRSSPLLIAIAWIVVILPTAWGFSDTLRKALKIFTAPAASAAAQRQTEQ